MLDFQKITPQQRAKYMPFLHDGQERSCEFCFANLYMWGRQRATVAYGHLVLFSQFNRKSVYPWPVGTGDKRPVLDAIIADAKERGIPCRITGLNEENMHMLEQLYPGQFRFHCDRDSYDYVYAIEDLAQLKGRKYQRKRNHYNRFREAFPYHTAEPLTQENLPLVQEMVEQWYAGRIQENPDMDYHMERSALKKALEHYRELEMEALVLRDGDTILALTMASRLSETTFDVHFEKARPEAEGAYTAINYAFARYLWEKYPQVLYLNREDDMGLEGLRKAKLSYYPHHMMEKCWACLLEDEYDY